MVHGKRICPLKIVIVQSVVIAFDSKQAAWMVIGPIFARILAITIRETAGMTSPGGKRKRKND